MKTGNALALRMVVALTVALFVLTLPGSRAGNALAQTPDAACAADSLYLISPDGLTIALQTETPLGLTVSWPTLDITQATCFSLADTLGLGFSVAASGGFGDRVDRVFKFLTNDTGFVGAAQRNSLRFIWNNEGTAANGNLAGIVNLANNGGIWNYDSSSDTWFQTNNDLPMAWRQVNTVALDQGSDGFLIAAFTRGGSVGSDPSGIYRFVDDRWERIGEDVITNRVLVTSIKISPTSNDHFLVGTARNGLFVTTDGGASFTQWTTEFDPDFPTVLTIFTVDALEWQAGRVMVSLASYGIFFSLDGGASFSRRIIEVPESLDIANPEMVLPTVTGFTTDPGNSLRILASLLFHGVYESLDGGSTWQDLYGDLLVPDEDIGGLWVHSAIDAVIDPGDPQRIVMLVEQKGLFYTGDGGTSWSLVGEEQQPESIGGVVEGSLVPDPANPGTVYVLENGHGLMRSQDSGQTWTYLLNQPALNQGNQLLASRDGSGDLVFGSTSGGIYIPGSMIRLSDTYSSGTSLELRGLDLGLEISFTAGEVFKFDEFRLVGQTFQGWAVWRAADNDPTNPVLVGLYDRVNPEDCIEGYCGDRNIQPIPQCFAAKRAACFNFDTPDTVRFFDSEIYNGFSYRYSVTSFDYGNTALTSAQNNSNEMLFSPRWDFDPLSPFPGHGNQTSVQVNLDPAPDVGGEEIYVYPNPLRAGAGIPGSEGRTVVFNNLPSGSLIRVFTTAGDDVVELGPELMRGGQIYWETDNRDREPVAPGVYLYKVEMPQQDDYWGRLVVIR